MNSAAIIPWPEVKLPKYSKGRFGRWQVKHVEGIMPGYFSILVKKITIPVLYRVERGKLVVWMSLANMERESHMPHIAAAHGHTVVMGLGMGMYLYNIIQKPEVTKVTVIERDPQVFTLLRNITDYDKWPGIEKVTVVIADAKTWQATEPVDFLYADIWKHVGDSHTRKDIPGIVYNVNPSMVGYWTQEFDYVDYLRELKIPHRNSTSQHYDDFAESLGVRLVGQNVRNYHLMAIAAVLVQTSVDGAISGDSMVSTLLKHNLYEMYKAIATT